MPATLTIRDETTSGERTNELTVEFLTERITVRELIRSRVYQEVKDYNIRDASAGQQFRGLVQPGETESRLNAPGRRRPREIDWHKQFDVALEAFQRNRVIILIDDRQAANLDEQIVITPDTQVTFLKLVPLVGG